MVAFYSILPRPVDRFFTVPRMNFQWS